MKTVNGYYVVKSENKQQTHGSIFVAMSNESSFVRCEVVHHPDGCKMPTSKFIFTFKDKLVEASLDGEEFSLVREEDIVGYSE